MTRVSRWSAAATRLLTPWRTRASVLLYHRVATPTIDPWSLAVTPEHFDEHMRVLARHAAVVRLSDLPSVLTRRGAPRRYVAVTFDDGYADNLHAALPALERSAVPATVFVIAGARGGAELWWDRLARLLLSPGTLPERLSLTIDGSPREWSLGASSSYDAREFDLHRHWRADAQPPTRRHSIFMELWRVLQPLRHSEQERCLAHIAAWIGEERAEPDARMLTSGELAVLAAHPLVEIGGHTLTHPRLSALEPADQEREIAGGKRALEDLLGRSLDAFAYPFGRPEDFTGDTVRTVRDAGFRLACANYSGTVRASSDPFRLPRAYVQDCDGGVFEERLVSWLAAPSR